MSRRRISPTNDAISHIIAGRDKAGLDAKFINAFKGRGVFATAEFYKGEFVLEYRGDFISSEENERRQRVYHNALKGFMFDFIWHGKFWTIDAARDDGSLGRLVNDEHINPNCKMKRIIVDGKPHLCLFALRDITSGEEITYNYGVADCPWRTKETNSGAKTDCNSVESGGASGNNDHCTQHSDTKSSFCNQETNSGAKTDCNRVESGGASGKDDHCTQHSDAKSSLCNQFQETNSGAKTDCNPVESGGAPGNDNNCTQHSDAKSSFCNQETNSSAKTDCNPVESGGASGKDDHLTQHSDAKSSFCNQFQETNSGDKTDCNRVESGGASGNDDNCTQHSNAKSSSCNQETNSGAKADCNRVESGGASGKHDHCTQHSEVKSSFCDQLAEVSSPDDSSHDDCSISSLENSEDDYVPGSSDSSSDESVHSHTISIIGRTAKTDMKMHCSSTRPSSVEDVIQPQVVPDQSSSDVNEPQVVPDQSSSVLVRGISKPTSKARVYDKKQYCLFCNKPLSKMARHLEQVHNNESEVAKALSFPKGSKERKNLLEHLRNKGNFSHNAHVLQSGKGDLVPCKKPRKDCESHTFVHCINCQGLFARKFLWRHMKKCKLRKTSHPKPGKNRVLSQSAYVGPAPPGTSAGLWKIFANMTHDKVVLAIKSDLYIRKLGEYFYNRVGSESSKHEYIRQKLREVGRLLITAQEVTPLSKMEDFVDPANFMHVITAVRQASGYDEEKCTFQRPSLALKLGHSLQKIASLVSFQAMMDGDSERAEKARNFSDMYGTRWSELISSHALRTQREVKWNAPLVLPFTEDVKMLHVYLDQKQEEYYRKLTEDASSKNWASLAKVTLAQTILFNRRREGEVSKMLVTSFASRNTDDLHEDVALALSEVEKKLCHHFTRIEIRGKRGRKVPVLLTPTMLRSMELLKEKREECAIPPENIYMFARPAAVSHLRGSDCLREFAAECGAKNPKALSSTKLRKHIATLSNVLNLNNTELDQLADFLGHDVRVHREYYRLPEGTLQLAKISKILMALETGRLGEFSGKNLDEIEIDPNEAVHVQSSDMSRQLSGTEEESDEDLDAEVEPSAEQTSKPLVQSPTEPTSTTSVPKAVKVVKKKKWETDEVKAVEKHLNRFIKTCTVPGKKPCEACIQAEPVALKDRDWLSVKFFVKNRITALKRKM